MNILKIIYLNCGETYEDTIDHRSNAHNLILHILICILHFLLVYYELTM